MIGRPLDVLASLVLEDGRRWGDAATDVQWTDARAVLDPSNDVPPYHFLTRSRGYSKSTDLAGVALAAMLEQLPAASRLYGLAADADQGRLLVDAAAGFATRTPGLTSALTVQAYRVIATRTASVLQVLPADAPGAWGLLPAFLVVDELAQWAATTGARRLWEATMTAMAKVPGARAVVISSAGDPAHWSHAALLHARADPLWRTHEVLGPPPWIDSARLEEQRRRLPESSYRRLFMNEWTASEDRLTNEDDLAACVTLDGSLAPNARDRYVVGVDIGIKRDRTAIVIAHSQPLVEATWNGDGFDDIGQRVVLDRLVVFTGSRLRPVKLDTVEEAIEQAAKTYRNAPVVIDPWQAIGLGQRLRNKGVQVREFNFSSASVGRLASTLHLLLRNRALSLPDDRELLDELLNVRLRETSPGVLRMDHDAGQHDDRAIALALAAQELLSHPPFDDTPHRFVPRSRGLVAQGSPFDGLGLTPQQERNWEERCRRDFDADRGRGAWDAIHHANNDERSRYRR